MDNKVVNFEDALKKAEQEENAQQHRCPHCELKGEWAATLLTRLQDMSDTDAIIDFVGEMFEWAFGEGKRDAWETVAGFAIHHIDEIDGVEEED